jgi:microcystin-dependent protein
VAEPFMGEIRIMSFNFAPKDWAQCNGQLLPINQNQALFSLLGTMYGGNGQTNFALPNLQARVPVHIGQGFTQGQAGGELQHTLTVSEMPTHTHLMSGSTANADVVSPVDNVLAQSSQLYGPNSQLTAVDPSTNGTMGGSQPHTNVQPYLTLTFCIALLGIFPSRN